MSYSHWEFVHSNQSHPDDHHVHRASHEPAIRARAADIAVDAALRGVPLPDGLLKRLSALVCANPDDPSDQIDWLGC